MLRIVQFSKAGGPEVLEFVETTIGEPGPNEVRIIVKAIGINRAEAMWRQDDYIEPVSFPAGLGYEAAGTVDAVGSAVSGIKVGDAVNVMPSFSMNSTATYGEVILVPDYAVTPQPANLSTTESASVWMMFVTAYGALVEDAKVGPGDFVVIPAASSSVGLAAIQIANDAAVLASGDADPVAFGRHFVSNPDLPERLRHGWSLNPYARPTFFGGTEVGYTDYAFHQADALLA